MLTLPVFKVADRGEQEISAISEGSKRPIAGGTEYPPGESGCMIVVEGEAILPLGNLPQTDRAALMLGMELKIVRAHRRVELCIGSIAGGTVAFFILPFLSVPTDLLRVRGLVDLHLRIVASTATPIVPKADDAPSPTLHIELGERLL
jgi:hypothetical protein